MCPEGGILSVTPADAMSIDPNTVRRRGTGLRGYDPSARFARFHAVRADDWRWHGVPHRYSGQCDAYLEDALSAGAVRVFDRQGHPVLQRQDPWRGLSGRAELQGRRRAGSRLEREGALGGSAVGSPSRRAAPAKWQCAVSLSDRGSCRHRQAFGEVSLEPKTTATCMPITWSR